MFYGKWAKAFSRTLIRRRIFGTETEYGISPEVSDMLPEDASKLLIEAREGHAISRHLPNGGKLYVDCGHPEYCTPECSDPWELTKYHYAGDIILNDLASALATNKGVSTMLLRDNIDRYGTSYGFHANYLLQRSVGDAALRRAIVPFLVSSPILFGSGYLNSAGQFLFSSRASVIQCEVSNGAATDGFRSILNMRDESHLGPKEDGLYRRLHITCHDSNVSQKATFLKAAVTAIILTLIEAGWTDGLDRLYPENPVEAIKTINADLRFGLAIRLDSGGYATALDIQSRIWESAGSFIIRIADWDQLPPWLFEAYRLWGDALQDIRSKPAGDRSDVSSWIDWKAKLHLLSDYQELYPDCSIDELIGLSMNYHQISPEGGLSERMVGENLLSEPIGRNELRTASVLPSSHPRAIARSNALRQGGGESRSIGWSGYVKGGSFVPFGAM